METGDERGRWTRLDEIFRDALERPAAERPTFVAAACADDLRLRAEVLGLLRAAEASESDGFLEASAADSPEIPWDEALAVARQAIEATENRDLEAELDRSGERIGPYRLLSKLGRGGMATVYLAERADGLWEQRVALKLIRRGLDTEDVIRRFRAERQILSSLDHPNIARLLDGGTTAAGLPYLVLEYVEGTPITEYCDERELPLEARLELFCDVGRAVQHAHRSLVVHRDLKPSNILVDHNGRVKLLDFGIAKILDPTADATRTRTGRRPLTPDYASPEQIGDEPITTVSDVYQLGLVLCELLCGRRPYDVADVSPSRRAAFLERMRPSPPGVLVEAAAAERRASTEDRLRRRLRGDLDTIVGQAIEREPSRRYASAGALVADLERHASGLPVVARPATLTYRTRKLARRRPWLFPAVAAAALVVGGYVFTLDQYADRLRRERNLARLEAERADEVREFVVDVFRSADPYAMADPERGRTVTVREALDLGADRVRTELSGRPELQAELLATIAGAYANLDLAGPSLALWEEALVLEKNVRGTESPEVARALRRLGALLARAGRTDSAEVLLERSLAISRSVHGPGDTAVAGVLTDLGEAAMRAGRLELAERRIVDAIDMLQQHDPLPAAHLATAYTRLLNIYPINQRMEEARAAGEEAIRLSRQAYGAEHPRTALALVELGDLHDWQANSARAVPLYREAIRILDASLGPEHEQTLQARNNLAVTLRHLGEVAGAEALHRQILAVWRRKQSEPGPQLADALQNLAVLLYEDGRAREAEPLLVEVRDIYDRLLEPTHYKRAFPRLTLASVQLAQDDYEGAERSAREASRILRGTFGAPVHVTAMADCRLARALAGSGRLDEARPLLESSVAVLARTNQPATRYEIECRGALADLYRDLGLGELAGPHLASLRELERRP